MKNWIKKNLGILKMGKFVNISKFKTIAYFYKIVYNNKLHGDVFGFDSNIEI